MRILIANDGFGDAGGVQSYLDRVTSGLAARGHEIAIVHRDAEPAPFADAATYRFPQFTVAHDSTEATLDAVERWAPDVCFSHNMDRLQVERGLCQRWPVVKFMHGYAGTCISGQKQHRFPMAQPCARAFGPACLALYGPRRCGQLSVTKLATHYRLALEQRRLFSRYRSIVVASDHMKREFTANGIDPVRIAVNPLFPTHDHMPAPPGRRDRRTVVFLGRMTVLKGADILIRAVADASARLGSPIELVLIGDGPQRPECERLASQLGVAATFRGWLKGDERWDGLRRATLLALPGTWPEPFGLVGLEAAALGVPAIAFDVGGIRQWLRPGETGFLVPGNPPRASRFAGVLVEAFSRPAALADMGARASAVAREMSLDRHLDRLEDILGT